MMMLSKGTNVISCNFAKNTNTSEQRGVWINPQSSIQQQQKIHHMISHSLLSAAVLMHLCCCCVHVCSEDIFSTREFT